MSAKKRQGRSITKPILKDIVDRQTAKSKVEKEDPTVTSKPLDPPALYEDPGGGYNADFTFPQE